jgi:hypothetical protein
LRCDLTVSYLIFPPFKCLAAASPNVACGGTPKKTPSKIPLLLHDVIIGTDHKENTSTTAPLLRACPLPSDSCKQTKQMVDIYQHFRGIYYFHLLGI